MTAQTTTRPKSLAEFYEVNFGANRDSRTPRAKIVARLVHGISPVRQALDIGCGDGTFTQSYSEDCERVVGMDLARKACLAARERGLLIVRGTTAGLHFPFRASVFDLVVAAEIIEHLVDPDALLDECMRVLRPGGRLIITTPNLASWYNRGLVLLGFQPYHTDVSLRHQVGKIRKVVGVGSGHLVVFTRRALVELVQIHRFELEAVRGSGVDIKIPRPARALESIVARVPDLASLLVVMVRKPFR